jgi:hypothetical protein
LPDLDHIINVKNARPIWKKLRSSVVPVVNDETYSDINKRITTICDELKSNSYIPSIGHGYLGYCKKSGCTRFVPILSAEDMTVYYLLVLSLQDYLVEDLKGIYGAWRSVPQKAIKEGIISEIDLETEEINTEIEIVDPYYSDTLSKKAWFKDWSQFNDLLNNTCKDKSVGNYVLTSDIANFYDTIDVSRLCNKIRSEVKGDHDIVSLLNHFLNFWDRRVKGYDASTKGIPQEIISDASRMLANFYLKEFDKSFIEYCDNNNIVFIRWADDFVLFGHSPKKLENALHIASRKLLSIGLNLSAAKTRHFSRSEFRDYRALDLLEAIGNKDKTKFLKELKRFDKRFEKYGGRIDTVVKASLNMLSSTPASATLYSRNFLSEKTEEYEILSSLNEGQLFKKYNISGSHLSEIRSDVDRILSKPYAAPRATYISFLVKYHKQLGKFGVTIKQISALINRISIENADSDIVANICAANAIKKIGS